MPLPTGLNATLRPYQLRGYEWLYRNARLGFGSLIADDMGLGKTLQVITTLARLREENTIGLDAKALIVAMRAAALPAGRAPRATTAVTAAAVQ